MWDRRMMTILMNVSRVIRVIRATVMDIIQPWWWRDKAITAIINMSTIPRRVMKVIRAIRAIGVCGHRHRHGIMGIRVIRVIISMVIEPFRRTW